ncbi:MAG TPA: ubiquinone/menaquinone biosynthesis methyltransferase [Candidatus Saccharimonadaceae bacterium]|jgi:demethylmenaquinone methyltransferase/2-methoxy-6-polyprenyl-1,4-benzoquinol methylase|nr:ubiquinone/menaquinone biosynthesis methyltransferase [Candidatus Saccharimonadaceae bacterium]
MPTDPESQDDRFRPHASREMASMFDDVSGRYDTLNRLMTLGQDGLWRRVLARSVPESARVVLDLCTGNGASLGGLRRPGRLVLGVDVSLGMLAAARAGHGMQGWAPRLACADAFRLPFRDASLDAVTVAFGVRNLRPRDQALAEIRRVLKPRGTLSVLDAAAPRPGWFAPFHAAHLKFVVPLLGRLSPDPSAYAYLSRSIFEFGDGSEFERALLAGGFVLEDERAFLLGATRLWIAHGAGPSGENRAAPAPRELQNARAAGRASGELPQGREYGGEEWRWWMGIQTVTSAGLVAAIGYGLWVYFSLRSELPLEPWQRQALLLLLVGGLVAFAARTVLLLSRWLGPPPRRRGS